MMPFMVIGIDALRAAKNILGTEQAVADVVGCSQPNVHYVLKAGSEVPAEWCIPLEAATTAKGQRIPRAAFRPDIYPNEPVSHEQNTSQQQPGGKDAARAVRADQQRRNPRAARASAQ